MVALHFRMTYLQVFDVGLSHILQSLLSRSASSRGSEPDLSEV